MSFLFGGGRSKSENKAFPWMRDTFSAPSQALIGQGQAGLGQIQNFLTGNDMSGLEAFRNSSGYQNIFNEAMRGVTSNAAARGLLGSGAMARAAQDRAAQLGEESYQNFLQNLMGVSQAQMQSGQNLAGLIGGAGGVSTSSQQGGLLGGLGALGQGIGAIATGFRKG